jgi:hypothetical protein
MRGRWKKLRNGQRQFITDDHGILNWAPSTGSVWFQGPELAAKKLERKFKDYASAKGLIESKCQKHKSHGDESDIGTLKELLADALLKIEKLSRRAG